jgi:hypothetical protein
MADTRFPLPLDSRAPSVMWPSAPAAGWATRKCPLVNRESVHLNRPSGSPAEGEEMSMEWAQMSPAENAAPCSRGPLPAGPGPGRGSDSWDRRHCRDILSR